MTKLTKTEKSINKLINELERNSNFGTPQRETEILYSLQMVSTLSQDGQLSKLNECIDKTFPEYGGRRES